MKYQERFGDHHADQFRAQAGKDEALRDFLASIVPAIASSAGCRSCQLLQSQGDPTHFVVIEVWDSVEAHQAWVQNIPAGALENVRQLLAGAPNGEYYYERTHRKPAL